MERLGRQSQNMSKFMEQLGHFVKRIATHQWKLWTIGDSAATRRATLNFVWVSVLFETLSSDRIGTRRKPKVRRMPTPGAWHRPALAAAATGGGPTWGDGALLCAGWRTRANRRLDPADCPSGPSAVATRVGCFPCTCQNRITFSRIQTVSSCDFSLLCAKSLFAAPKLKKIKKN